MTRLRSLRLLPVALLATTAGCFATRQDVVTLQQDLATVRAETQRSDSLQRAQFDRVVTTVRAVSDSLNQVGVRLARFQGEVLGRLTSQDEQLLTIQELTGQSQRRLQELRSDLERRGGSPGITPSTGAPALTMTMMRRGRSSAPTNSSSVSEPVNSPSELNSSMKSRVLAAVRLWTAIGTPRRAMLRARFAPMTASPVTPI